MERLQKILTQSVLFNYFRMDGNVHKQLQKAVYKIATDSLLKGLNDQHKEMLMHEHYHQPDPNGYAPGENLSLLEAMINEACFFSMGIYHRL